MPFSDCVSVSRLGDLWISVKIARHGVSSDPPRECARDFGAERGECCQSNFQHTSFRDRNNNLFSFSHDPFEDGVYGIGWDRILHFVFGSNILLIKIIISLAIACY